MCSSLQRKVPLKLGDISSLPGFATESIFALEPIIYRYIYMYVDVGVCLCIHKMRTQTAKYEHCSLAW